MVTDRDWAEVARGMRDALHNAGFPTDRACLPGEDHPCGGSFAQHAAAYLISMKAVTDHQLRHLGREFVEPMLEPVYQDAMQRILAGCQLEEP